MTLPAIAPTTISVNATEIVSQNDNSEAASASPIHNAATNQTFSTAISCHASIDTNDLRTRKAAGGVINRRNGGEPVARPASAADPKAPAALPNAVGAISLAAVSGAAPSPSRRDAPLP